MKKLLFGCFTVLFFAVSVNYVFSQAGDKKAEGVIVSVAAEDLSVRLIDNSVAAFKIPSFCQIKVDGKVSKKENLKSGMKVTALYYVAPNENTLTQLDVKTK